MNSSLVTIAFRSSTWRASPALVNQLLDESGASLADVADAIDQTAGTYWKVNTRHPAWLAMMPAQSIRRPVVAPTEPVPENAYVVHATDSGGGIGDTIIALYACAGLAQATGRPVVFSARWSEWLGRAKAKGVHVRPFVGNVGLDISGGWDGPWGYHKATAGARSRVWAYCQNMATGFGVPTFAPGFVKIDREVYKTRAAGTYAVLAPFTSGWLSREWPRDRWPVVARGLIERGITPIAIGSGPQQDALAETFGGAKGVEWRYGCSVEEVAELLLGAAVTIGLDSGIVHFGGMLGVPTVAVHAGSLPHDYLFSTYQTVSSVTPPGLLPRTDANRTALATVDPSEVVNAALRLTDARTQSRRAACQACDFHGEIGEMTGHCKKRGPRASCASCRVVFKTSPASRCPLNGAGGWPT